MAYRTRQHTTPRKPTATAEPPQLISKVEFRPKGTRPVILTAPAISNPPIQSPCDNMYPNLPSVTVMPIGETFDRWDTILPLEKDSDYMKTNQAANWISSQSSDISSSASDQEYTLRGSKEKPLKKYLVPRPQKTVPIFFDGHYRAENQSLTLGANGPTEIDAELTWANRRKFRNTELESESETEFDIAHYIEVQETKREGAGGASITGETFWHDPDRSIIRNLHTESHSITGYGDNDERIFGCAEILRPILTAEERKMLGIPKTIYSTSPMPCRSYPTLSKTVSTLSNVAQFDLGTSVSDGGLGDGDGLHASSTEIGGDVHDTK